MSQAINKEDIISGSPFKDIADEMQVALGTLEKFDAKIVNIATHLQKDLVASNQKTLQSIEAVNKAELEAEKLLLAKIKTQQAELKLQEQLIVAQNKAEKAHQQKEKQYNREIQQAEKANSVYSKVDKKLSDMVKRYRELAIRKELGAKLTDKEAKDMDFLAAKIQKYDTALKNVDATTGKYQRNVGNYKSTFDGMTFSVTQLAREMPAFGNSVQTGFMAISNNLPMFFDEIAKLKQENIELAKSGEQTKSVFKTLAGSLMSTQVLLSVGVTLLTLYGAKLVEWGSSLFKVNKEVDEHAQKMAYMNKQRKESAEQLAQESSEFIGNINALRMSNANSKERSKMISEINEKYGTSLKNLKDEKAFTDQLNASVGDYLKLQIENIRQKQNLEKIENNIILQDRLRNSIKTQQEKVKFAEQANKLEERAIDLLNQRKKADGTNETSADRERSKRLTNEANILNEQARILKEKAGVTSYQQETFVLEQLNNELGLAEKRMLTYDVNVNLGAKSTKNATKTQKQFNTEIEYTNDYISQQIELLKELQDLENQRLSDLQQSNIDDVYANMMKRVTETGIIEIDELERLINEKTSQDIKYLEAKTNAEIAQLEFVYQAEKKIRKDNLDAKYKDLILGAKGNEKAIEEINANYKIATQNLDAEEVKRREDVEAKKVILAKKSKKEVKEIEKKGNEEINQMNDALIDAQIEYYKTENELAEKQAKEKAKREAEQLQFFQQIQEAITDFLKDQIDKRIAELQREFDFAKQNQDRLQNLAAQGNIFAKDSIAEQIQIQRDAQQEQMRLEKQKQNLDMISTGLKTFEGEISKGKSPAEALATTLVTTKTLVGLLSNLNFFAKGTDNAPEGYAVTDEQGAELHLDKQGNIKDFGSTKGAQMKYLEKGDKIITASKTAQLFSEISNAKKIASVKDVAGNSYDLKPLLQEMQGMRTDIKNNATQIKVHWDTMGNIIEQVTKGNDRVTNRYRVKQ
jgi:hypothetical protein